MYVDKICSVCGAEFRTSNAHTTKCSVSCVMDAYNYTGLIRPPCKCCGKRILRDIDGFCSLKCKKKGELAPKCEYCGKEFTTTNVNRKYCSSECGQKNLLKRRKIQKECKMQNVNS